MGPILIDTCAAIWISSDQDLTDNATAALDDAADQDAAVYVSPITAWEIGMLAAKDRLKILMSAERWFDGFLRRSGARLAEMPPNLLIGSSFLPGSPPKDPADRIIAATARELEATLITRDRHLLEYARQGHIRAIEC